MFAIVNIVDFMSRSVDEGRSQFRHWNVLTEVYRRQEGWGVASASRELPPLSIGNRNFAL